MLLSGKYSASSLQHILTVTECHIFLRDKDVVLPSFDSSGVRMVNVPEEHDLLTSAAKTKPYKYDPEMPTALNDPLFVLHTSGSVGKQKAWQSLYTEYTLTNFCSLLSIGRAIWPCTAAFAISQVLPVGSQQHCRKARRTVEYSLRSPLLTAAVYAVVSFCPCTSVNQL